MYITNILLEDFSNISEVNSNISECLHAIQIYNNYNANIII